MTISVHVITSVHDAKYYTIKFGYLESKQLDWQIGFNWFNARFAVCESILSFWKGFVSKGALSTIKTKQKGRKKMVVRRGQSISKMSSVLWRERATVNGTPRSR